MNTRIFFILWSLWLSLEFLLGPYSHVRIHDAGDGFLPQAIAAKIQFARYGLSYFADYMASGVDASAQILVPFTNLNNTLLTIFPGWLAMGIIMFLQRFIASYFTFKLLKEFLKINYWSSIIGGLIFSLFNFSAFSFTFYHQLGLPALPLVLYSLERIISFKNFRFIYLIGTGILLGYTTTFIYSSVYLLPFIFFWFLIRQKLFSAKVLIVLLLFSALTIAIQLPNIYALWANAKFSQRNIWDPTIFLVDQNLTKSILLDFKAKVWANIISIAIILISLRSFKKTKTNYFQKILLLSTIFILVMPTIFKFTQILFSGKLGILGTFSFERFDMLVPFVLSITVATSMSHLLKNVQPILKLSLVTVILILLISSSIKIKIETLQNYAPYRNLYLHPQLIDLSKITDPSNDRVVTITGGGQRASYPLAYGLYTVDSYITLYPKTYHDYWQKVIAKRIQDDKLRYDDFVKWGNRIYLYGPQDFYSQDSIEFQKYYDLDLLSLAGVKYIISQKPVIDSDFTLLPSNYRKEFIDWDKFSKVQKVSKFISGDYFGPPLYIYENKKAFPRFFVLDNGQVSKQKVRVKYYSPDKIALTINSAKPASLIATINYYPWWKAAVNGQETSISKYQDTFMSLEIPKGDNTILFEYDPPYKI